jgi:hypothetical protein
MGELKSKGPCLQHGPFLKLIETSSPVYLTPPDRFAMAFQVPGGIQRGLEVIHV